MKPWHIVVVVVVIIVVFGSAKLPEFARSLGQSARILRKEVRDMQEEDSAVGRQNCCEHSDQRRVEQDCRNERHQQSSTHSCRCSHHDGETDPNDPHHL